MATEAGRDNVRALATGRMPPNPTTLAPVTDALDGATLTGTALTTSATPTVEELEACVGVLGGKINEIIAILKAHDLAV